MSGWLTLLSIRVRVIRLESYRVRIKGVRVIGLGLKGQQSPRISCQRAMRDGSRGI